jgi:F-type H+/Na+-transporting ATPase subunit beta
MGATGIALQSNMNYSVITKREVKITMDELQLNVALLRRRVPNLTTAARSIGLRAATVSNLCTGKIPVGRAEVRTLVALSTLAGCSLDELILRGGAIGMIETGIKVVDVFAPLVRGGTIGFVARPGMGQMVLLAELFRRMKQRGFATIFWMPEQDQPGISDVTGETECICHSADEVYERIMQCGQVQDVLLGADRAMVLSGAMMTLKDRLQESGVRPVTLALVDTLGEGVDEETPYGPLDTLLGFDFELSVRGYYPALNPVISTSTLLEGAQLEATHFTIQQRARKLLRRYRELRALVTARGMEKIPEAELATYRRGERLEAFLTQPFYVAEAFTKKSGEWLSLHDSLDSVRRIVDGSVDEMNVEEFLYIGRLA